MRVVAAAVNDRIMESPEKMPNKNAKEEFKEEK